MSYGHSKLRDIRRHAALPRLQKALDAAQSALKHGSKVDNLDKKIKELKACIENTQTNLGKGTTAMAKPSTKLTLVVD